MNDKNEVLVTSLDETDNDEADDNSEKPLPVVERQLPRNDCPEKIIFVLDLCKEEDATAFHLSEGTEYSPLYITIRALKLFLQNKNALNPFHQYALMVIYESPIWLVDFTKNPALIIKELEELKEIPCTSSCNLSQVFNLLEEHIQLPIDNEYMSIAPTPYIVRTIFLYGRSHCLPDFADGKKNFELLTRSPYFFLDVLFTHETPSDSNNCEKIYHSLCDLDNVGWSYIFEVSRNATKYHNLCSRLLAHPLQRPIQKDAHYLLTEQT